MKVGDLVKWSDLAMAWHAANGNIPHKKDVRQRGIIYGEAKDIWNRKYCFVHWDDGEQVEELPENLELVRESR